MEYTVFDVSDTALHPGFEALVTMDMYGILDRSGRELFAYHWHPTGVSAIRTPHFHASSMSSAVSPVNSNATGLVMSRVHFPTHRIELPELVRFLITELGVKPRRQDWAAVLARIEQTSR